MSRQAQKELLDAELDFHKKMSSGEDTTDLKRKLGQLQVEVIHTCVYICTQTVCLHINSPIFYLITEKASFFFTI